MGARAEMKDENKVEADEKTVEATLELDYFVVFSLSLCLSGCRKAHLPGLEDAWHAKSAGRNDLRRQERRSGGFRRASPVACDGLSLPAGRSTGLHPLEWLAAAWRPLLGTCRKALFDMVSDLWGLGEYAGALSVAVPEEGGGDGAVRCASTAIYHHRFERFRIKIGGKTDVKLGNSRLSWLTKQSH